MKGITLIEILLVIVIFGIISATTTPFLSSFLIRNNREVALDRIVSEIYKAQNYAMDGKVVGGNSVWGVCVLGNVFRMFNGSCSGANFYEDYILPNGISVSGITSLTFGNLRGEPSAVSNISIVSSLGTNTITLNEAGMVEEN